jgi:hypothetical protein
VGKSVLIKTRLKNTAVMRNRIFCGKHNFTMCSDVGEENKLKINKCVCTRYTSSAFDGTNKTNTNAIYILRADRVM